MRFFSCGILVGAALWLGGCGQRIAIPEEPDDSIVTGEIAYVVKYRWEDMPAFGDIVLTRGQILFAIQDGERVTAWFSDRALPRENAALDLPFPVMIENQERRQPVHLAEGPGNTLWVAFTAPELAVFQFNIGVRPPVYTGLSVQQVRPGILGGMACDRDSGFVYLAETAYNEVSKWEPSATGGRRLVVLAPEGDGDGFVREPRGLFFFNDSLLVADSGKSWIQVLNADVPRSGRGEVVGADILRTPSDVWVDRLGRYYVADTGNNRIVQVSPQGDILEDVTQLDPDSAQQPVSVAATDTQVWAPNPATRELTIYQINTIGDELP